MLIFLIYRAIFTYVYLILNMKIWSMLMILSKILPNVVGLILDQVYYWLGMYHITGIQGKMLGYSIFTYKCTKLITSPKYPILTFSKGPKLHLCSYLSYFIDLLKTCSRSLCPIFLCVLSF